MGQAFSVVVMVLCLAGALAALYQRQSGTDAATPPKTPRWWVAGLCSVALLVTVVVVTAYLQA